MKIAVIAALALGLGASAVARADQVIVLNSEEASYSILSRGHAHGDRSACRSAASRIT